MIPNGPKPFLVATSGPEWVIPPSVSLGAEVRSTVQPRPPVDARISWLQFGLIATGTAVGLLTLGFGCCYAVARIVSRSAADHLRMVTEMLD